MISAIPVLSCEDLLISTSQCIDYCTSSHSDCGLLMWTLTTNAQHKGTHILATSIFFTTFQGINAMQ